MPPSFGTTAIAPRATPAHVLDYVIPSVILLSVLVVLAPVPPFIVDLLLAANLTVSVLALLGALAARTPLEMSVFPTFLLGSTLVRLVLNIATTRLILSRAAIDGAGAAGQVVQAFGEFVSANNLVVGAVIFAIIAVIQCIVITAGATRTSEVAARFALDGLPGRQMAIDSDVQAGTISRDQARLLRLDLQRQADFFASMDGASRFVRGEAVASIIITLVNIFGGLAIGVVQHSMSVPKAFEVYSRLTIGDGLTSAVPALFVSVATGLLISRSSQVVDLSRELGRQFTSRPHVLAITGVFLALLSLTDLPFLPLAAMAAITLTAAVVIHRQKQQPEPAAEDGLVVRTTAAITSTGSLQDQVLAEERIVVEVGHGLIGLISGPSATLPRRSGELRTKVAGDLGIVVPAVTFRDNLSLPPRSYRILIAQDVVCTPEIPLGSLLAIPAAGETLGIEGTEAIDPLNRRRAIWISQAQSQTARHLGATLLDETDCVGRSLEAAVRGRAAELLSRDSVARLIESLRITQPALVEQSVPGILSLGRIHRTLQCLLREGVPIRPLSEVIEIMTDHATEAVEPWQLAERVRRTLARAICRRVRDPEGRLVVVHVADSALELLLTPATNPRGFSKLVAELRRAVRPQVERGAAAVIVVPDAVRRNVRETLVRQMPELHVLADAEVVDESSLEVFATVGVKIGAIDIQTSRAA